MAFGTRFRIEGKAFLDGMYAHRIDIEEDGFGGSVTNLTPAQDYINPIYGPLDATPDQLLRGSRLRFAALDTTELEAVFNAGARAFRVSLYRTTSGTFPSDPYWRGYVVDDFYRDRPDVPGQSVELEANWGVETLKNDPFDDTFVSGFSDQSLWTALFEILNTLGLNLPFEVIQEWHPFLASDKLGSSVQTLENLYFVEENFRSERGSGEDLWLSRYDALTQILNAFNLRLEISNGAWRLTQLENVARSDVGGAVGSANVWSFDNAGALEAGQPTTDDLTYDLSSQITTGEFVADEREFIQRVAKVSAIHSFADNNLAINGGFEDGSSTGSGAAPDNWSVSNIGSSAFEAYRQDWANVSYGPGASTENEFFLVTADDYDTSQDITDVQSASEFSGTYDHVAVAEQTGDATLVDGTRANVNLTFKADPNGRDDSFPQQWVQLKIGSDYLRWYDLEVSEDILKGDDATIALTGSTQAEIPEGAKLVVIDDGENDSRVVSEIEVSETVKEGDSVIPGSVSESVDLSGLTGTAQLIYFGFVSSVEEAAYIPFGFLLQANLGRYTTFSLPARLLTATGSEVSGSIEIRFGWRVKADGTSSGETSEWSIDTVRCLLTRNGEPLERQSVAVDTEEVGRDLSYLSRLGDGPTSDAFARLRVVDANSNFVELTDGWQTGNYGSGDSSSGRSLNEHRATELIRRQRGTLRRRTFRIFPRAGSEVPEPHEIIEWDGEDYSIEHMNHQPTEGSVFIQGVRLNDFGTGSLTTTIAATEEPPTGGGTLNVLGGSATGGGSGVDSLDGASGDIATETGVLSVSAGTLQIDPGGIANAKLTNDSVTVTAGNQLTGGGSVALGSSVTLDVDDGPGSGLDADTLDGQEASAFMESIGVSGGGSGPFNLIDGEDLQFSAGSGLNVSVTDTAGGVGVEFSRVSGSVEPHNLSEHSDAIFGSPSTQGTGALIASDGSDWDALSLGTDGNVLIADSGNANGLGITWGATVPNADKLDSQEGTYYTDASNLNAGTVPTARLSGTYNIDISGDADTLDGQDASAFVESLDVSGGGNTFTLIDGEALQFTSGSGITISLTDTAGGVGVDISRVSGSVEPHSLSEHEDASMGSPVTQGAGTLIASDGTNWESVSVGSDGQVLQADSGAATGVSWTTQVDDSASLGGVAASGYARTDQAETFSVPVTFDHGGATVQTLRVNTDHGSAATVTWLELDRRGGLKWQYRLNGDNWQLYTPTAGSVAIHAEESSGNVGFGGNTSPSYAIDATGSIRASTTVFASSDARIKSNLQPLAGALGKVRDLHGFTFDKEGAPDRLAGVIAQHVQKVLPEAVSAADDERGTLSVDTLGLVGLLIEAIKELDEQVNGGS